ncbi:uncharacterized protein LACBIDRAFT_326874 [Laccaria bicolor S238N-H82]|uniref:Predicted protein n=1 Tax=Laccaria bicolor (strain S238N-H82 / ATCC MYA-4686) TaxID=486041 RepID=B0D9Z1_LACBS|nr:uncharacterized protein LACBIDRAFT_326874 [Laccaria bicolor S238N-H82]EDR08431.1 predicted protein [Laccaria bicolor S238N-H82]|eukprot:XP_001880656.1 predicted protein [Laccaria bicolor S238N-H82]
MAPKRGREQPQALAPEVIAKRTRRHLDELELFMQMKRSNYAEPTLLASVEDTEGGGYSKGRARQTISDKRNLNIPGTSAAAKKKKSTMNVRTALLYRKNFATLLEESNITSSPSSVPTYLRACAPPSAYPPRMICSVSAFGVGHVGEEGCPVHDA